MQRLSSRIWSRAALAATAALLVGATGIVAAGGAASASSGEGPHVTDMGYVDSSTLAGGTPVYLQGHGFTGATAIHFGSIDAPDFTVEDDNDITVTAPPSSTPGAVEVTVTTPVGTSTHNPGDVFTYVSAPFLSYASGSVDAADPANSDIYLSGYGLWGATSAQVGAATISGSSLQVSDDEDATISPAPALPVGTYPLEITTPAGSSSTGSPTVPVTYDSSPQVDSLNAYDANGNFGLPESPLAGGGSFALYGSGLAAATEVLFGSTPASDLSDFSDNEIDGTIPAATTAGPVDVTVVTPAGTSALSAGDVFFYEPGGGVATGSGSGSVPVVSGVGPSAVGSSFGAASGPMSGGEPLTLTGSGFTGATAVNVGSNSDTSFTVVNDTEIDVNAPALTAAGSVPITVTNAAGSSVIDAAATYTATTTPIVTGTFSGGPSTLDISGSGFTGATAVSLAGHSTTDFTVNDDSDITVQIPAGAVAGDVQVTGPGGTSVITPDDAFGYDVSSAPVLYGAYPGVGSPAGGDPVCGSDYLPSGATATALDFAATTAPGFNDLGCSPSATSPPDPASAPGPVPLTLVTSAGDSPLLPGDTWYYGPADGSAPAVTGTDQTSYEVGYEIEVYGAGFTGATAVTIGGVAGTNLGVVDDDELYVEVAPNTPIGADHIVVTTPAGSSTATTDDLVNVVPPSVTAPAPPPGATASQSATSDSSSGTATANLGSLTASATGIGGVTVASYAADPESSAPSGATGTYLDVAVSSAEAFTSLDITVCNLSSGQTLEYYDGTAWVAMSPQSYDQSTGCATATLDDSTSVPLISQLTGTPVAVVTVPGGGTTTTTTTTSTTTTTTVAPTVAPTPPTPPGPPPTIATTTTIVKRPAVTPVPRALLRALTARAKVVRGHARLELRCARALCRGTLQLRAGKRVIAVQRYRIRAGRTERLSIAIRPLGRRLLAAHRNRLVVLEIVGVVRAKTLHRRLILVG